MEVYMGSTIDCKTGDKCPIEGYWVQIETGEKFWHLVDDVFQPLSQIPYERAHYKYIGK